MSTENLRTLPCLLTGPGVIPAERTNCSDQADCETVSDSAISAVSVGRKLRNLPDSDRDFLAVSKKACKVGGFWFGHNSFSVFSEFAEYDHG